LFSCDDCDTGLILGIFARKSNVLNKGFEELSKCL